MTAPRITRCQPVPRLTTALTADEFRTNYVAPNTPVILPLDSAAMSSEWSLPRLQSLLGPLSMSNVFRSQDGRYTFFDPKRQAGSAQRVGLQRQRMTFDEFVHRARGTAAESEERKEGEAEERPERKEVDDAAHTSDSSQYYLYGEPMPAPLQPLLPPPTILSPIPSLSSSLLWVAVLGSVSPLHYDLSDGVLCQLHRSKHFLLAPPRHYAALAPYPTAHAHDRQSQLHLDTRQTASSEAGGGDTEEGGVECWVGEVRAGEMLYLPYGWWHQVESKGECVSVTYRWDEHQQQLEQIRAVSTYTTSQRCICQQLCDAAHMLTTGLPLLAGCIFVCVCVRCSASGVCRCCPQPPQCASCRRC